MFCDIYIYIYNNLIIPLLSGLKSESRKKEIKGRLRLQYGCHGQDFACPGEIAASPRHIEGVGRGETTRR